MAVAHHLGLVSSRQSTRQLKRCPQAPPDLRGWAPKRSSCHRGGEANRGGSEGWRFAGLPGGTDVPRHLAERDSAPVPPRSPAPKGDSVAVLEEAAGGPVGELNGLAPIPAALE